MYMTIDIGTEVLTGLFKLWKDYGYLTCNKDLEVSSSKGLKET